MKTIDRRALFSSGAAAALLAASGVSLEAAPHTGGRLRVAVPRDGVSLGRLVRGAAFDSLTEIAANGVLQGELATGWSGNENGRVWHFDLRDDVAFHNGAPMRAQDVVASLSGYAEMGRLRLRTIEATGVRAVRLELQEGDRGLPLRLADQMFTICQDGHVDLSLAEAIGTGCYRTRRHEPDRGYLGQKVEQHYKDGRAGWADSIEAVVIPDPAIRSEALRDGYVDIAVLPAPEGLREQKDFIFHPSFSDMALAARRSVGVPREIGANGPLDDGRLAERWWRV
ncbi:ABC transporter substrate-binding protein [Sedimentitalea sp. JM2-8]|uniref:ABC transporter substrate-binding protein n=1 Tax=Sedimentitalea xiamensis TaxID=3050037 RepID=A0ABT7F9E5_9RHOB|nr:ABC transporter substrate-binding protein [Sedimentitalea xiamensis]MDK3071737.1 ABC transporter substrate-binding protein [Sedimentitalea xiamensis]